MTAEYSLLKGRFQVRKAVKEDMAAILSVLRARDRDECKALGMSPGRGLRRCVANAVYVKSAFLDGEIVALGGLCGDMLSDVGVPWLLTSNKAFEIPVTFFRAATIEIEEMLEHRRHLENYVHNDYTEALKLFSIIGFSVSQPIPMGKDGALFRRITLSR